MSSSEEIGFVYVGVRPDLGRTDGGSGFDLLTHSRCRAIAAERSCDLTLSFELDTGGLWAAKAQRLEAYHQFDARLLGALSLDIDIERIRTQTPLADCVGMVAFDFLVEDLDVLEPLYRHRDLELSYLRAYRRGSIHWGTQNWGGLVLRLHQGDRTFFRSLVDVFMPEDEDILTGSIHLSSFVMDERGAPPKALLANEWTDRFPAPDASREPVLLGRCHACGETLIEDLFVPESLQLVFPCKTCGHIHLIKINSPAEVKRTGIRFEFL